MIVSTMKNMCVTLLLFALSIHLGTTSFVKDKSSISTTTNTTTSTTAGTFVIPSAIDFSPFLEGIRAAIKASNVPQFDSRTSTSLDCSMPSSSIMFTYANAYTFPLVVQQHKALEINKLRACIESRFVVVCLDSECIELCTAHKIPNCVLLGINKMPASSFGKKSWSYITWLKNDLLREASKVVDEFFFFDADVLVLRNPWEYTRWGASLSNGTVTKAQRFDLMFQRERGRGLRCDGTVNTGVVYARNTTVTQNIFKYIESRKNEVLNGSIFEQNIVGDSRQYVANVSSCALKPNLFVHHCSVVSFHNLKYMRPKIPLSDVVTYHATCVSHSGTDFKDARDLKLALMKSFILQVKKTPEKMLMNGMVDARTSVKVEQELYR